MKIAVLIKTVKLVYAQTGTDVRNNYIDPDDIVSMLNPLDEVALEWALKFKDLQQGVTVTALSVGDCFAEEGLRRSLVMGVDQAVHVQCAQYEQLDAMATSALFEHVCRQEAFDLILCGATAIDTNDGLEGPYLAERLSFPHLSNIVEINLGGNNRRLEVQRVVERGDRQLMECRLPALLTIQRGTIVPRYPTLAGFLRGNATQVRVVRVDSLPANLTRTVGCSGPKPKKPRIGSASSGLSAAQRIDLMLARDSSRQKAGGMLVEGNSDEMIPWLDRVLSNAGILQR